MKRRADLGLALLTLAGCHSQLSAVDLGGGDSALAQPDLSAADGGPTDDGGGGALDAAPDLTPPLWGLDTRPSNPTCLAPARPTGGGTIKGQLMYTLPLRSVVDLDLAPNDPDTWYATLQEGVVMRFPKTATGAADVSQYVDISSRVHSGGEGGLLSLAFHPNFAINHHVYLSYTANEPNTAPSLRSTVSRFTDLGDGTLDATPAAEVKVLPPNDDDPNTYDQPYANHNGGNVLFGPDGLLYFGLGDGGLGGDPGNRSQDTTVPFGKMLRLDVDNIPMGQRYGIPPDNPFVMGGGMPEIYAYGFRNPWRWTFDRATGQLWMGDVGQDLYEEVDIVERGGNYGWRLREGAHCYNPATNCPTAGLIDPVVEYTHASVGSYVSITGGYVYRGHDIPELTGSYVFADFTGPIYRVVYDASGVPSVEKLFDAGVPLATFAEDADGELYYAENAFTSRIYKLARDTAPPTDTIPHTLSATGCVDPTDATKPAAGLIPYDVAVPFWSDGAAKKRWIALPDSTTISVGSDGDWDLPIGSVAMKEFSVDGARVETRLFVHHADGDWAGYSYEWNDAGTDATLLASGKVKALPGGKSWTYPSRSECLGCHGTAAGRTLGLETAQLNGDLTYAATGRTDNQITTLDHLGFFTASPGDPSTLPQLPSSGGSAPVQDRARAYLHSNCAFCHRPGGLGLGPQDLRFTTAFAAQMLCNVDPTQGDLAVSGAKLLAPGHPEQSIVPLRMRATDVHRMPPVASTVVDTAGVDLIESWITSLTVCP